LDDPSLSPNPFEKGVAE
jgi:hypothetical protein